MSGPRTLTGDISGNHDDGPADHPPTNAGISTTVPGYREMEIKAPLTHNARDV